MLCVRPAKSKLLNIALLSRDLKSTRLATIAPFQRFSISSRRRPLATARHHNDALSRIPHGRNRLISTISAILLPPIVFAGLVVTLWTWKCFMMVLFQNKIIYMPFLPPNARSDTIEEYSSQCGRVKWREEHIKSGDGTNVALAVAEVGNQQEEATEKVVLYFQGNASSLPPRLPDISRVLLLATRNSPALRVRFIGVSYRGYWKSGGRPSEVGMRQDAQAALEYALRNHSPPTTTTSLPQPLKIIIWGQSIGCAFASHLAANITERPPSLSSSNAAVQLETLILETPFTSASSMLQTLYPQKWLPYRYLSAFLWNRLDTIGSLQRMLMASKFKDGNRRPHVVVLEGEKDELVPREHGDEIQRMFEGSERFRRVRVEGALHTQVLAKGSGRIAAARAIQASTEE